MSCTPEIVSNIFRRLPVGGGDGMQEINRDVKENMTEDKSDGGTYVGSLGKMSSS